MKIAILCGGVSSEREISLKSGQSVYQALQNKGYETTLFDITERKLDKNIDSSYDFIFIALHGEFGEDGKVQKILDDRGFLYSGSGPKACQLAMDKLLSKKFFAASDLLIPEYKCFSVLEEALDYKASYPVFVKPTIGGSSIGVSLVREEKEFFTAVRAAFNESETILIEEAIFGREVSVGIVGAKAFPVIEIKPESSFYDYKSKYESTNTKYIFPEDIPLDLQKKIQEDALKAHESLGCEGFSRVDFILRGSDNFVLEVNAIPGLTEKSLLPKEAQKAGIQFDDLCDMIIQSSKTILKT